MVMCLIRPHAGEPQSGLLVPCLDDFQYKFIMVKNLWLLLLLDFALFFSAG